MMQITADREIRMQITRNMRQDIMGLTHESILVITLSTVHPKVRVSMHKMFVTIISL